MKEIIFTELCKNIDINVNEDYEGSVSVKNELYIFTSCFNRDTYTILYIYNIDTGKIDKHKLNFIITLYKKIDEFIYFYSYGDDRLKYIDVNQIKKKNYIRNEVTTNRYVRDIKNYINIISICNKPYILEENGSGNLFKIVDICTLEEYYKFTIDYRHSHFFNFSEKLILYNTNDKNTYVEVDLIKKDVILVNYPEKIKSYESFIPGCGGKILFYDEESYCTYDFGTKSVSAQTLNGKNAPYSVQKNYFFFEYDSNIYYYTNGILYIDIKFHISDDNENVESVKRVTFTSEVTGVETEISLSILKERTDYFSDLSTKFDDDTICSLKINNDDSEKYKNYIFTGCYTKNDILEIFKVCNYLQDIDTFSLSFKIGEFCKDDIDFSIKALSVLSNTGYTHQLKRLFNFIISNYDRNEVYDIISKEPCYNELFRLMFYNIDIL